MLTVLTVGHTLSYGVLHDPWDGYSHHHPYHLGGHKSSAGWHTTSHTACRCQTWTLIQLFPTSKARDSKLIQHGSQSFLWIRTAYAWLIRKMMLPQPQTGRLASISRSRSGQLPNAMVCWPNLLSVDAHEESKIRADSSRWWAAESTALMGDHPQLCSANR